MKNLKLLLLVLLTFGMSNLCNASEPIKPYMGKYLVLQKLDPVTLQPIAYTSDEAECAEEAARTKGTSEIRETEFRAGVTCSYASYVGTSYGVAILGGPVGHYIINCVNSHGVKSTWSVADYGSGGVCCAQQM